MKLFTKTYLLLLISLLVLNACKKDAAEPVTPAGLPSDVATKWADMTLKAMYRLGGNSPTYSSRALGYMGITMYESIVNGSTTNKSLAGQLNGLSALPKIEEGQEYDWTLALNAGQAWMLKNIYPQVALSVTAQIDSLEKAIYTTTFPSVSSQATADRSIAYGQAVAQAIFEWSKTDGGYQGYTRNFDAAYMTPVGPSFWISPSKSQSASKLPLHPYWGNNRTFAAANSTLPIPTIIPYSENPQSAYYLQFMAVYTKNNALTQAEKDESAWWGDDPTETSSPPGHSYNLATIAIRTANATNLMKAAETYARVGMAVGDAFVCCWKTKYKYSAERPSSYVNKFIDASWVQFWPEPPFPAFSSGHSNQSAATATVLADLYGTTFAFTDNTWNGRTDEAGRGVNYKNRSFSNFWDAALESGYSRFLGGIHTQQDNETGLAEGKKIGTNINAFAWKK